jgi:hypothetical protein
MKGLKLVLLAIFAIALSIPVDAQSFYSYRRDRDFIVTLGSGTANYFGEMVNPGEWGTLKPNIVAGAEYYISNRISARGEFSWFMLSGDDKKADDDRKERNLNFRSSCLELNVTGAVYLSPQGVRFYQRSKLNLYAFAGIGLLYMNPKTRDSQGNWQALQPLMTEATKYSKFQPVIPFGLGVKVKMNPFFNVIIEGGYRKTFTDYIDDVSTSRYVDYSLLTSDLAKELSDRRVGEDMPAADKRTTAGRRGNPDKDDNYMLLNVKVQYYLPYQVFGQNTQRKLYKAKRKSYYRRR